MVNLLGHGKIEHLGDRSRRAGSVGINRISPTLSLDMPFGGWKGSASGRDFSRYATDYWTELKAVYIAL